MVKLKLDQEKEKGQFSLTIITGNSSVDSVGDHSKWENDIVKLESLNKSEKYSENAQDTRNINIRVPNKLFTGIPIRKTPRSNTNMPLTIPLTAPPII